MSEPNPLKPVIEQRDESAAAAAMDMLPNYERGLSFATLNRVMTESLAAHRQRLYENHGCPHGDYDALKAAAEDMAKALEPYAAGKITGSYQDFQAAVAALANYRKINGGSDA